ncbi:hypothetical protein KC19_3G170600 [Ceratodon purpureus]|uniref:Uncharacterized protein n=1 Tax=Ceratodon purpureus TaxID=3225 RepID=A0A8T0ILV6_CERPU|nr:hypothetical protein KC19_3G170600 [Ceratodon purpureus]
MDPVSMFVGSVVSCAVTELIKVVMQSTQAAVKCKTECKKLHEELDVIKPDVESIEKRLAALRQANYSDAHDDLQMVEAWLARLKNAIEAAKVDVYRCNSGRFSLDQHKLSVRLTSQYNTITNLGNQRVQLFLQLGSRMHGRAQVSSQVPSHGTQHPPQNWFENPGDSVLRRMADERNDALRREEIFRQSMSPGSSVHSSGWGYEFGGYDSSESSSHGGYRSEADSSGHGWDRPRAHRLRHETPRRDVFLQGEEQGEADRQLLRRHTMAGMASAFGHEPVPTNWKY